MTVSRRTLIHGAVAMTLTGFSATGVFAQNQMRIAVVYFSKTDHTTSLADEVKRLTGADTFRVEVVDPYPTVYTPTTEIVKKELENGIVRAIKPVDIEVSTYDTFVLCTPTWWHHVAKPLESWIKSVDLSGKFILTANTHGGGGLMHTREDFESLLKTSKLGTHLTHFGNVNTGDDDVAAWLKANGLI
ncbi:MAG: flavodoxin [Sutterellaceae bacterium]|nr:flavodoxin [Sutterellaceae bacterium]